MPLAPCSGCSSAPARAPRVSEPHGGAVVGSSAGALGDQDGAPEASGTAGAVAGGTARASAGALGVALAQEGPWVLAGLAVGRHWAVAPSGAGAASAGAEALPQAEGRALERVGAPWCAGAGPDERTGAPGAAGGEAAAEPHAAAPVVDGPAAEGPAVEGPAGIAAPAPHGRDGSGWRGAGGGVDAGR